MLLSWKLVKFIAKNKIVDFLHVCMQPIFKLKTFYSPITIHCDNDENDHSESKQIRQVLDSGWFHRSILAKA